MADSSVAIKDANGADVTIDTYTNSDGEHRQVMTLPVATEATRTSVAAATTEKLLLAANDDRVGFMVNNNSTAVLHVGLGTVAVTAANATVALQPQGYYEVPFNWKGEVRGIWAAANGNAVVTELV